MKEDYEDKLTIPEIKECINGLATGKDSQPIIRSLEESANKYVIAIETHGHQYLITANTEGDSGLLRCQFNIKDGQNLDQNLLHEGPLQHLTWIIILNYIIGNELVEIAQLQKPKPGEKSEHNDDAQKEIQKDIIQDAEIIKMETKHELEEPEENIEEFNKAIADEPEPKKKILEDSTDTSGAKQNPLEEVADVQPVEKQITEQQEQLKQEKEAEEKKDELPREKMADEPYKSVIDDKEEKEIPEDERVDYAEPFPPKSSWMTGKKQWGARTPEQEAQLKKEEKEKAEQAQQKK